MMETPAWRALTLSAQALYPWVRLEWRGAKFNNNGKIRLSVRQAAAKMGCGVNTAARAFQELQAKGFLVVTEGAPWPGGRRKIAKLRTNRNPYASQRESGREEALPAMENLPRFPRVKGGR